MAFGKKIIKKGASIFQEDKKSPAKTSAIHTFFSELIHWAKSPQGIVTIAGFAVLFYMVTKRSTKK